MEWDKWIPIVTLVCSGLVGYGKIYKDMQYRDITISRMEVVISELQKTQSMLQTNQIKLQGNVKHVEKVQTNNNNQLVVLLKESQKTQINTNEILRKMEKTLATQGADLRNMKDDIKELKNNKE